MRTRANSEYLTNREWLRNIVGGQELILKGHSALLFLELFGGYCDENEITVYAKSNGIYSNINYHVVDSFDNIDYVKYGNVLCSTASQAINDMLSEYDTVDEQALYEGLSDYYHYNKSFDALNIKPENIVKFDEIKIFALNYYKEGAWA